MQNIIHKSEEIINHSIYKTNNIFEINRYISEKEITLRLPINRAIAGEKVLLVAPTGSGKTYSTINLLKELNILGEIKSIFIVPNTMNVEQIKNSFNIAGAYGHIPVMQELEKEEVTVMTWDKFIQIDKKLLKDYIVVLDEVHQTYTDMFRLDKINKLYENLNYCKGQIDITATPKKLNFEDYSYIVEYKQKQQTKYNVKLYSKVCDTTICNIINNSNKFALLKDDTNYLNFIKESCKKNKVEVISSNTKDLSKIYRNIIVDGTIGKSNGICNTSVLLAGVNIYDKDITDVIVVGEKDIATIKQYVARFRDLEEVNIHIFNNYKNEESKVYDIEWLVDTRLNEINIDIDYFNKRNRKETFIEEVLEISPIRLNASKEYYWSNEEYKYIVNEAGIRNNCYTKYYNKADIQSFKVLLGEYFENIKIVEIDDANNKARKVYNKIVGEEKEQALLELEKEKSILVGAVEILSEKISNSTQLYLEQNNLNVMDLIEEYENKDIKNYILVGNIAKIINSYSNYVINSGYNYNLSWCIANKGNRAKGKFINQINNIIYREIENKYPKLMRYVKVEDKLYNLILDTFAPGKSYTEEHLKFFCEAAENTLPMVKITPNKVGELLAQIYSIELKQYKKVPPLDFIYNKIYNSIHGTKKKINVYTIKNFITLEDIISQNKLDDLSLKVLKNIINNRIQEIDKKAIEINNIDELFIL